MQNHGACISKPDNAPLRNKLETQFGFRANHLCESQLLLTVDDLARAVDKRLQVDCSILDFSKAFYKVPHARLIAT